MAREPKEKPGEYARWLKTQEREVEKSAKTIAAEYAVKDEIVAIEEKLKRDISIHSLMAKSVNSLHRSILENKRRLRKLKEWKAGEPVHPKTRLMEYSANSFEMMSIAIKLGNTLVKNHIKREVFGSTAKARKS